MKQLLLTGLNSTTTTDGLVAWLSHFGPVTNVRLVREGDGKAPFAVVSMDISDARASFIVNRIVNYWHDGALVSAAPVMHDDPSEHMPVIVARPRTAPVEPSPLRSMQKPTNLRLALRRILQWIRGVRA